MARLLDTLSEPSQIKKLGFKDLYRLAGEIRSEIIGVVSKNGGHLASNLGTVELTLALHYVFDFPRDKLLWDVGHQSYTHKIITGRKDRFHTLRQAGGISGFPNRSESEYDAFGSGHASTSVSAALGFCASKKILGQEYDVIAVIGDGSLTGGMAYEALNNAEEVADGLIVVLNDNEMSINKNVGALASYLSKIRMNPGFVRARRDLRSLVRNIPAVGGKMLRAAEQLEDHLTYFLVPGVFFESLDFSYLGPFDGHNIEDLVDIFRKAKGIEGNKVIHVRTKKGKGYEPAEQDSCSFHGTAPFDIETGVARRKNTVPTYTEIFGGSLLRLAEKNDRIIAVTAAMTEGTGLTEFSRTFPERFFDVGIAEEHAVTFAAAMAAGGLIPVVSIYSTFLQRSLDQIIHDVCLQNLPVVFCLDRAGIVGEDGCTHQGVFDLSFLRFIPNLTVLAPSDELEMEAMLEYAVSCGGPAAIRYPRRQTIGLPAAAEKPVIEKGKAELICRGKDLVVIAVGSMVIPAMLAAEKLAAHGLSATVVNARFVKPLDKELILESVRKIRKVFTVEENVIAGGFGSAVSEMLQREGHPSVRVYSLGLPDAFIEHAHQGILLEQYAMTSEGIYHFILKNC